MKISGYPMLVVFILLVAAGCEEGQNNLKVIGTGPTVTKNLDLSSFNNIEHTGVADFYITIGSPQSVVLKAQQNIIDVMTYRVENHSLRVGLEKNISIENSEEIRFDITLPAINNIKLTGVGDFVLSGEDQGELTITITGVGNITAYDMKVGTCNVTFTGVGGCKVYVTNELNVTISGVGKVYYKGDPSINLTITGLGQLINEN